MSSEKATDLQPTLDKRDDDPALVTGEDPTRGSETAPSGDFPGDKSAVPPILVSRACSEAIQYLIRKLRQGDTFNAIVNEERAKDTATKTDNRDSDIIAEYTDDATPNPHSVKVRCWEHEAGLPRYIAVSYEPNGVTWTYRESSGPNNSTRLYFYFENDKEGLGVDGSTCHDKLVSVVSYRDLNGVEQTEVPSEVRELCQEIHPDRPVMIAKQFLAAILADDTGL